MRPPVKKQYTELMVLYKYTIESQLNPANEFETTKNIIIEAMKDRTLDSIVATEGLGSWQMVNALYKILQVVTHDELATCLADFHAIEKDFIRLARHRKKKEINKQDLNLYLAQILKNMVELRGV